MRIITGKYKGRFIRMPKGIRPTQDKVRKALFDILGDVEGASFLELFAGSGAVGLEAASRGVAELVLVESGSRLAQSAISGNVDTLGLKNCTLLPLEADAAIRLLHRNKMHFDIIFLDPPYYRDIAKKTLQMLGAYDILAPNGFAIAQHFKKDILPDKIANLARFKQAGYGETMLSFYKYV